MSLNAASDLLHLSTFVGKGQPREWANETKANAIQYLYLNKTLPQLRNLQRLINTQIQMAYNQRNTRGLESLQIMEAVVTDAINQRFDIEDDE